MEALKKAGLTPRISSSTSVNRSRDHDSSFRDRGRGQGDRFRGRNRGRGRGGRNRGDPTSIHQHVEAAKEEAQTQIEHPSAASTIVGLVDYSEDGEDSEPGQPLGAGNGVESSDSSSSDSDEETSSSSGSELSMHLPDHPTEPPVELHNGAKMDSPTPSQSHSNDQKKAKQPTCRNFVKGRCRFGKKCKFLHDSSNTKMPNPRVNNPIPRKRNILGSVRWFLRSLVWASFIIARQLLDRDISNDISDMLAVIDFLVENQFLRGVELRPGESEAGMKIVEINNDNLEENMTG
jgi:hypothetical protein